MVSSVAQTGYDMVLVETEHILFKTEAFTNFLVMARHAGPPQIVTIPEVSRIMDGTPFTSAKLAGTRIHMSISQAPLDGEVNARKYIHLLQRLV